MGRNYVCIFYSWTDLVRRILHLIIGHILFGEFASCLCSSFKASICMLIIFQKCFTTEFCALKGLLLFVCAIIQEYCVIFCKHLHDIVCYGFLMVCCMCMLAWTVKYSVIPGIQYSSTPYFVRWLCWKVYPRQVYPCQMYWTINKNILFLICGLWEGDLLERIWSYVLRFSAVKHMSRNHSG